MSDKPYAQIAREEVSLIDDLQKSPGYIEWYLPKIEASIEEAKEALTAEEISPEEIAMLRNRILILRELRDLPQQIKRGHMQGSLTLGSGED